MFVCFFVSFIDYCISLSHVIPEYFIKSLDNTSQIPVVFYWGRGGVTNA